MWNLPRVSDIYIWGCCSFLGPHLHRRKGKAYCYTEAVERNDDQIFGLRAGIVDVIVAIEEEGQATEQQGADKVGVCVDCLIMHSEEAGERFVNGPRGWSATMSVM